jgi:hypothetical protein
MSTIRSSSVQGDLTPGQAFDSRAELGESTFAVPSDQARISGCFVTPDGLHVHVTVEVEDPHGAAADVAADLMDQAGNYVQDLAEVIVPEGF